MPARAFPARPWRVFRLGRTLGQISDHARQDSLPRGLRDRHAGHEDDGAGEHLHAIPRNCVAFCVADGLDPLLSRVKPRLFGSCPRHFLHAGTAIRGQCRLFLGGASCRLHARRAFFAWPAALRRTRSLLHRRGSSSLSRGVFSPAPLPRQVSPCPYSPGLVVVRIARFAADRPPEFAASRRRSVSSASGSSRGSSWRPT